MGKLMSEEEVINKIRNEELNFYEVLSLEKNGFFTMTDAIKWEYVKKYPNTCLAIDPTHEMLKDVLGRGIIDLINRIDDKSFYESLSEDDIVKMLRRPIKDYELNKYAGIKKLLNEIKITPRIVSVLAEYVPILLTNEKIKPYINEEILWTAVNAYCKSDDKHAYFVGSLDGITDEMWKKILTKEGIDLRCYIENGIPVPRFVLEREITSEPSGYYTACKVELDEEMLKTFFDKWHDNDNAKSSFKEVLDNKTSKLKVLESYPDLYRYIGRPKIKETELAVSLKPKNLRYVKKQTEELCLMALKKDKSVFKYVKDPTDAICDFMGLERTHAKSKYTAPYYLVKAYEELAGEEFLVCVRVIAREDIESFMNTQFVISFGNLYDNEKRETEECFSCIPITEEEYTLLEKLELDSIEAGNWNFKSEEEEDEEDWFNESLEEEDEEDWFNELDEEYEDDEEDEEDD